MGSLSGPVFCADTINSERYSSGPVSFTLTDAAVVLSLQLTLGKVETDTVVTHNIRDVLPEYRNFSFQIGRL